MSGRKVAFGVYRRYILFMNTKKLTTDQKLDLVLTKVTSLDTNVGSLDTKVTKLDKKVTSLQKDVVILKTDVKKIKKTVDKIEIEVDNLSEMTSKALIFGAKAKDRLDAIDTKLNKHSFTPFTSGAFVA